jgi:hypothetical protein
MPLFTTMEGALGFGRGYRAPAGGGGGTGTSSNDPGINAAQIMAAGNTSNAWYWIKTSGMSEARQVWCNMTDAGGGWMLASYNGNKQAAVLSNRGQWYPVAWSNGQGTLSGQFAVNAMDLWYHNGTNQCSTLMRLAFTTANAVPTVDNSYIGHTCHYFTNAGSLRLSTASGVAGTGVFATNNLLMSTLWSSVKGYTLMSTLYTVADADWMYNTGTNFYWNPCLPQTGQVTRNGNAQGNGGWMRTQDRDSWGLANIAVNASGSGNTFIGSTLAVFIK